MKDGADEGVNIWIHCFTQENRHDQENTRKDF